MLAQLPAATLWWRDVTNSGGGAGGLGRMAFRRRRFVLVISGAILVVAAVLGLRLFPALASEGFLDSGSS